MMQYLSLSLKKEIKDLNQELKDSTAKIDYNVAPKSEEDKSLVNRILSMSPEEKNAILKLIGDK